MIFIGDRSHLKPVKDSLILQPFSDYAIQNAALYEFPWKTPEMIELSEFERQTKLSWINVLNRVRVEQHTESDIKRFNILVGRVVPHSTVSSCVCVENECSRE